MTPSTPLPCSVWATITSTGFAVAQKIVQTSGVSRMRFFTLIGNPPRSATTNKCPAPTAIAFFAEHDERVLAAQHAIYRDETQMIQSIQQAADELSSLFEADMPKDEAAPPPAPPPPPPPPPAL